MSANTNRRRASFIGLAGISMAAAGFLAPGAFAANTVDGDVTISNTETVQVLMDASGKIDSQRVYEQLVLRGKGKVDISNPVSTKGLRNLDGFGGFDVRDDQMRIKTDVNGVKKFRSVSDNTKDLPVEISVKYTLDGKKVRPGDVVGKSGDLEVRFEVINTTGKQQDVTFPDGFGVEQSRLNAVLIPMVGSLTTTLPPNFTRVQSAEANAAGDGRGGTQMSFTMTLIPPIGSDRATFGYTARIKDGVVPTATLSMLPVDPLESPSFKGGAASYLGGAESGADLTAGATTIDTNLLKIRDGARDLVAGIRQLRDGADKLSAGLTNDAAPGARKLADGASKLDDGAGKLSAGTGDLSAGAGKLRDGAGDLSDGTGKLSAGAKKLNTGASALSDGLEAASAGGPDLVAGVAALKAGAEQINTGLTTLNGSTVPGLNSLNAAAASLINAVMGPLTTNLANAGLKADAASAAVTASTTMDSSEKTAILTDIGTAKALALGVRGALLDTTNPTGFLYGLGAIKQGTADLSAGIDAQTSASAAATDGTLKNGMAKLIGGLTQLQTKGGELVAGLDQLSAGANQLKAGTGDLKAGAGDLDAGAGKLKAGTGDLKAGANKLNAGAGTLKGGTGQLSAGAGELADGLGTAAAGSGQLAEGLNKAAKSAPALPEGAQTLSDQGTSQLVNVGNATAMDYGLKYALLEAGAERAATAQPYGSPEGATELTAYKFELAGEDGAGSANVKRGIASVVLLAGAGALAARRRGILG